MTPPSHRSDTERLEAAFDLALELPADQRLAWLQEEFSSQPEMLRRITTLLAAEAQSRDLFEQLDEQRNVLLQGFLEGREKGDNDPRIGNIYGSWQVTAHLGSGGLAEVYLVERADGRYEQRAALKILRSGILGQHARELFLRERQLLAHLDHSGIVRIIDAGETSTGAPWLVMELAEGEPIDRYCHKLDLALHARLKFLADAADILSAAHASLVVHGDLKAEHILISPGGSLRLLDFGIAQALNEQGLASAAQGYSLEYASPEQAEGQRLSTLSDVYQMGLVIAQTVEPCTRSPLIDAVIAKATAIEPQDRYPSMAGLAADLRAILNDRPLVAHPDSRLDSFRRAVRQNRLAAVLAAIALIGSVGWTTTATLSSSAISRERNAALAAADRERRGKQVLLQLFRRADLLEADSLGLEPAAAAAMLDETLTDARGSLADDPALLADLINWTARAHERAGNGARVLALSEEELALASAPPIKGSLREAAALAYRAFMLERFGDGKSIARLSNAAMALLGDDPPPVHDALDTLLSVAWANEGDWQQQSALFERALVILDTLREPGAEIEVHSGLARSYAGLGDLDRARTEVNQALAIVRDNYGARHPRMTLPLSDLGRIEEKAGNYTAAVAAHREALAIQIATGPQDSPTIISHRNNLATVLAAAGKAEEAIREYRLLLQSRPDGLGRGETAQNLGAALVQHGDYGEADEVLTYAEKTFAANLPQGHPRRVFPALTRAEMRLTQHRWAEAETDARKALVLLEKALPAGHFATGTARCRVGMALLGQAKRAEAARYVRPALEALDAAGDTVPARYVQPCRDAAKRL